MSSTAQIEHQAESHRAHISQLVDELRERATPGEVLDQFLGWEDGREMARTFGRQIKDNPLPLAMIGAGIAWLMVSDSIRSRQPVTVYSGSYQASGSDFSVGDAAARAAGSARDTARGAAQWTRETAANVSDAAQSGLDSARGAVSSLTDSAQSLADSAQSAVGRARQSVSETANGISGTASNAWQQTSNVAQNTAGAVRQAGANLNDIARDQPLLVAGIGLALGMVLGSLLPASETENQLFGEQADALRDKAGDLASEGYRKAKTVVQRSYEAAADAAQDEAENQGLAATHDTEAGETDAAAESARTGDHNGGGYGSSAYPHH